MAQNFKRSDVAVGNARTVIYGPVGVGVTSIVFSGTFSNLDSINKQDHTLTLEIKNVSNAYVPILTSIPIPYGASAKCPKIVLQAGEYVYATGDAANMIEASINILERS